jgi:hypothetical protein
MASISSDLSLRSADEVIDGGKGAPIITKRELSSKIHRLEDIMERLNKVPPPPPCRARSTCRRRCLVALQRAPALAASLNIGVSDVAHRVCRLTSRSTLPRSRRAV